MVTRTPGVGDYRHAAAGDLIFDVVTVRNGRTVALRGCRDQDEAFVLAGLG